jgi:hypothetical protein
VRINGLCLIENLKLDGYQTEKGFETKKDSNENMHKLAQYFASHDVQRIVSHMCSPGLISVFIYLHLLELIFCSFKNDGHV